jgi:hypothetical protein
MGNPDQEVSPTALATCKFVVERTFPRLGRVERRKVLENANLLGQENGERANS